jgi:xylan 1,4-beta-xylosidase
MGIDGSLHGRCAGQSNYNWTILDGIFDSYRAHHVRPYVEIGFMPEALSIHPEPYHTTGIRRRSTMTSYRLGLSAKGLCQMVGAVYQWTAHDLARYGQAEMTNWFWETWNEANIGYWQGKPEDFFKLHDYAVRRRAAGPPVGPGGRAGFSGRRNSFSPRFPGTLRAAGPITRRAGSGHRLILFRSTPRDRRYVHQ